MVVCLKKIISPVMGLLFGSISAEFLTFGNGTSFIFKLTTLYSPEGPYFIQLVPYFAIKNGAIINNSLYASISVR